MRLISTELTELRERQTCHGFIKNGEFIVVNYYIFSFIFRFFEMQRDNEKPHFPDRKDKECVIIYF